MDFANPLLDILTRIPNGVELEIIRHQLNEEGNGFVFLVERTASLTGRSSSNSIVVFFRMLTSAFLQENEEEFFPFLFSLDSYSASGPIDMVTFCRQEVEAMDREADNVREELAEMSQLNLL